MSIAVVTTCYSYFEFLPAWAASVAALDTQPDEVVVVTSSTADAAAAVAPHLDHVRLVWSEDPFSFGGWFNQAVAATSCEWVAWLGCDDTYRPHALDGIERDEADVVAFGMQYAAGQWRPNPSNAGLRAVRSNEVPCGSPFRRRLWEALPFQPQLAPYEDWALWVGFAHLNARFATTGRIDFDYRAHADTENALEPYRSRIADWVQSL